MKNQILALGLFGFLLSGSAVWAAPKSAAELATTRAEAQIKNLLEPLLQKYCHDECKLLSVKATADLSVPEDVAPGFEDSDPASISRIEPSSATIKLLVDEKLGPVSRKKLLDLLQQYADTLDYTVKIDTQLAHFPEPAVAAGKVAELREKVTKKFKDSLEGLFSQFCPNACLLTDLGLKTETVNLEEAQYGMTGEYFEDAGVAIRVKDVSATILIDDSLTPGEQANILEMAKLKTNELKNVSLASKSLHFPRPGVTDEVDASGRPLAGVYGAGRGLASTKSSEKNDRTEKSERSDRAETNSNSNSNSHNSTDNRFNQKSEDHHSLNQNTSARSSENNDRQEKYERFEKIERVESGDAVQEQLKKFQIYALVFGCGILSILIFIAFATLRSRSGGSAGFLGNWGERLGLGASGSNSMQNDADGNSDNNGSFERAKKFGLRLEADRLRDELMAVFAQQPKVAKYVFGRVLQEEGVEISAAYIHLFGESVMIDLLRDPSLQSDVNELTEFYAKNPIELTDEETLLLLKKLHSRTTSGKLSVMGRRSTSQFDFLIDMDGLQIYELVRNESMTVKAIILTQCDNAKRGQIFGQLDEVSRMKLLAELSRIDYLPRDYITNVANALKRKRNENPKLNTEALPGSEVLVNLLERAPSDTQLLLVKNLERANPDSARTLKNKLVSIATLRFLRDNQLLEVVLSLKHDELIHFLKGATTDVRNHILTKTPRDLAEELADELRGATTTSREQYQIVERKVLNRMKVMANEGLINLSETNERMFASFEAGPQPVPGATNQGAPPVPIRSGETPTKTMSGPPSTNTGIRKAGGW